MWRYRQCRGYPRKGIRRAGELTFPGDDSRGASSLFAQNSLVFLPVRVQKIRATWPVLTFSDLEKALHLQGYCAMSRFWGALRCLAAVEDSSDICRQAPLGACCIVLFCCYFCVGVCMSITSGRNDMATAKKKAPAKSGQLKKRQQRNHPPGKAAAAKPAKAIFSVTRLNDARDQWDDLDRFRQAQGKAGGGPGKGAREKGRACCQAEIDKVKHLAAQS